MMMLMAINSNFRDAYKHNMKNRVFEVKKTHGFVAMQYKKGDGKMKGRYLKSSLIHIIWKGNKLKTRQRMETKIAKYQ